MTKPLNPPPETKPSAPGLPLTLINETNDQRERKELHRRLGLLRVISLVLACCPIPVAWLNWLVTVPAYPAGAWLIDPVILNSVVLSVLFLVCFLLARPSAGVKRAKFTAFFILVISLIGLSIYEILLGIAAANGALLAMFIFIPLLASVFGLGLRNIIASTACSCLAVALIYSLEEFFKLTSPVIISSEAPLIDMVCWLVVLGLCGFWVSIISIQGKKTQASLVQQMDQLGRLTSLLNATNAFGSTLSRELAGMTADLHITSRQQATNSQEQVAAVTEVTTSLEELNETANQIASSAAAAATSANQTVEIATTVRNASEQARSTSREGNEAVDQAAASVERVRNRIELLGQRLLHLTEQTRKVGTIIDIIDEIADETHLLALNASIEAAGAIHSQAGESHRSVRGDRFGVIAQEVKNLADRSRESTEEVRQAITEMQGAVAAAVLVAEEGKKETSAALSRSQIAGSVITKLNDIITNNAAQAEEILSAVEEVNIRCDEISIATGQQRSANQQILSTMRTVAQVSQESAGAVSVLSETVSMVNRQVDQLNATMEKTNQSLRLAAT
jgi:methyl-accepting chemotaxis protein